MQPKKNIIQSVAFSNVQDFLEFLPESELRMVDLLRRLIFDSVPHVTEKLSYNVPYYKVNRNICFIWPASILWGTRKSYEGVRMGFNNGYLMKDEISFLDKGNRKQVCFKDFTNISEIDIDLVRYYIFEAVMVDRQFSDINKRK